ncbi:MAG TPA: hypothetical protein VIG64_00300 [Actinomycetota bacterium]
MAQAHAENRRDFLRRAGTVAWAAPLILTLTAGRAAAQVSCAPAATQCGTWSTPLDMCIPLGNAVICCNDCVRGTGAQDTFCFCA